MQGIVSKEKNQGEPRGVQRLTSSESVEFDKTVVYERKIDGNWTVLLPLLPWILPGGSQGR